MIIDWEKYKNDTLYRVKVLRELSKENEKASKDASNNPEIQTKQTLLEEADKRMTEKRSTDERISENYGDKLWAKLFGSHVLAGLEITGGIYALPWVNAALTPSTYLDALGTPTWLGTSANLGTSGYFTYKSGKEFINNPTLENGIYAGLSLIPATRANYSELGKVGNFINELRVGRLLLTDVKNTNFVIKPIEHVSSKGITEGDVLRASSNNDVGFHFSPLGSRTTINIQKLNPDDKFIRQGWWTYTNRNSPVIAEDKGLWTSETNPLFYEGVGKWNYPELENKTVQDALHASLRDTNYMYTNNYEGEGELSYMSTDPSFGINLSKNIEAPTDVRTIKSNNILRENDLYSINNAYNSNGILYKIGRQKYIDIKGTLYKITKGGKKEVASGLENITNFLKNEHEKYISKLPPLSRELYLNQRSDKSFSDNISDAMSYVKKDNKEFTDAAKNSLLDDYSFVVDTEEYLERIEKAIRAKYPDASDDLIERILDLITKKLIPNSIENNNYFIYRGDPLEQGLSFIGLNTRNYPVDQYIGLNNSSLNHNYASTLWHEFMHNLYGYKGGSIKGTKPNLYLELNKNLIGDPKLHLLKLVNSDTIEYLTKPTEVHSRVMEVVKKMIEEGIDNPRKAYYKFKPMIDKLDLNKFDKDYIIKLLGGLITTSPIILNN